MKRRTRRSLVKELARANTPAKRLRALDHVRTEARRRRSLATFRELSAVLTLPENQNASYVEWQSRLDALETFRAWLEDVDAWLATQPPALVARIPAALWPTRMDAAALAWATRRRGEHPDRLRSRFIAAQSAALDTTRPWTPAPIYTPTLCGWSGIIGATEEDPGPANAAHFTGDLSLVQDYNLDADGYRLEVEGEYDTPGAAIVQRDATGAEDWEDVWTIAGYVEGIATFRAYTAGRIKFRVRWTADCFAAVRPDLIIYRLDLE